MRTGNMQINKKSVNALNPDTVKSQLDRMVRVGIGKTYHGFGWRCNKTDIKDEQTTEGHLYTVSLSFGKKQQRERTESNSVFNKQFADIVRRVVSHGRTMGWNAVGEQTDERAKAAMATVEKKQEFAVALPAEYSSHFAHIFDRESQIRIVYQAIQAAKASNFTKRNHCLLWGKPACGKTEILLAFEKMMGPENVIKLDATMTTKAGAENLLLEMEQIPPIMILEEAEKCNPINLPWLLGVLDQRGEIIKTNARIGSLRREAKCLCLATVNNLAEFQGIMAGALASRFQHKVYCPRPGRMILEKILAREIREMHGDTKWIQPVLEYCLDVEKTDDPRRAIAVLDGRERLLTGEYQKDLRNIFDSMVADGMQPPAN